MKTGGMTAGRLTAAAWAAVLAPAVGTLPGVAARIAGEGAWLAPLVALPAALALGCVLERLARGGLAEAFVRLLGTIPGRALIIIYIMWALVLAGARLRLSGQRLLFTAQYEMGLWFFLGVLAAVVGWLAWRKTDAFVRAAALFFRILTLTLIAVLGLTVVRIRTENLFPLWVGDALAVLKAVVPTLGMLCYGVYAAFLWEGGETHGWKRRTAGGCAVLALLLFAVLGNMGAELTGLLEDPFITLSKYVGVEGAFQRVESLVSALWLLGDLALLGLLLWAVRRMMAVLRPGWNGKLVVLAGTVAVLLETGIVFRDVVWAQRFERELAVLGNLLLGASVPVILLLLDLRAENRTSEGISCAFFRKKRADIDAGKPDRKNFEKKQKRC